MLTQYTVMAVFCRADQRRRHIDQMWAPDGRLAVSSLRLTTQGVDDVNAHISQVHDDPDRDKGLAFTYDQHIESGDCLLLPGRCSRRAPRAHRAAQAPDPEPPVG